MRALVVYESMFGNNQAVARAVADGLRTWIDADTVEVGVAAPAVPRDIVLLVIGAPTHAFSLSRPGTRRAAGEQSAAALVSAGVGLREWLEVLTGEPVDAAAFDTRVRHPRVPGSAARAAGKRLQRRGFRLVVPAESFWVEGTAGPLLDDELVRARAWGAALGARTHAREAVLSGQQLGREP